MPNISLVKMLITVLFCINVQGCSDSGPKSLGLIGGKYIFQVKVRKGKQGTFRKNSFLVIDREGNIILHKNEMAIDRSPMKGLLRGKFITLSFVEYNRTYILHGKLIGVNKVKGSVKVDSEVVADFFLYKIEKLNKKE